MPDQHQQTEIDWTRGEQLGLLRQVPPCLSTDSNVVSKRSILAILKAIDEYTDGKTGWCWASHETLGTSIGMSERTARRACKWLEDAGLIAVIQRGKTMSNKAKIVWSNLADLIDPVPSVPIGQPEPDIVNGQSDRPVVQSDRPVVQSDRPVVQSDRPVVAGYPNEHPVLNPKRTVVRGKKILQVRRDAVLRIAVEFRRTCRLGESSLPAELIWRAATLSAATDWDAIEVARSIASGRVRNARSFLAGAIDRATSERPGIVPTLAESDTEVSHG